MIEGGCLCGAIRYESQGRALRFAHCHCPDCRKASGATFASTLVVESSGFRVTAGEADIVPYASSPGKVRCFCKHCGSPLFSRVDSRPDVVLIRAGSLDGDPGMRPEMHIWVKAKAPWDEIHDDLPQYEEGLPSR
jgi:hypothetical protein